MKLLLGLVAASVVILASGVIHGTLSDRWGAPPASQQAGQLLQEMPDSFGPWKLLEKTDVSQEIVRILSCTGYINRVYAHDTTGEVVSVFVFVGPSGPISVHTPEICYPSQDFKILQPREEQQVSGDSNDTFWQLEFEGQNLEATRLRVMYAWSDGSLWKASETPRIEFASQPYLYKVQLATELSRANDESDVCQRFLRDFVPHVKRQMIHE